MKVLGLDGKEYNWPPNGHITYPNELRERSEPHLRCRNLLKELFPAILTLEEVPIPGSDGLRVDFFLVATKTVVEVHGEQHYKFIPFFHGTKIKFFESKNRDKKKINWCVENNIKLVELPHYESIEEWRARFR